MDNQNANGGFSPNPANFSGQFGSYDNVRNYDLQIPNHFLLVLPQSFLHLQLLDCD